MSAYNLEKLWNAEVEMAALGCMMQSPKALRQILSVVDAEAFFRPAHKLIFEACKGLHDRGEEVDTLTVKLELERMQILKEVGGLDYLFDVERQAPAITNGQYYAERVRDFKILRDIRDAGERIQKIAVDPEIETAEAKIKQVTGILSGVQSNIAFNNISIMKGVINRVWDKMDQSLAGKTGASRRVPTHLAALNRRLKGYPKGEISVVAGRTSMGKTVFGRAEALSISQQRVSLEDGTKINQPVLYVSTEVSDEQLVEQMLAGFAKVSTDVFEGDKELSEAEYAGLGDVAERFYELPLYFHCKGDKSLAKIKLAADDIKQTHGVYPVIILDYLQALVKGGERGKTYQLDAFLSELKSWIQDEQICVIALAQIARDAAKADKDGKVRLPSISDISDSKAIDEYAATVLIIHRPEYYESRAEGRDEYAQSEALIVCCKVRYGSAGVSKVLFEPARAMFFDYTYDQSKQPAQEALLP